MDPIVTLHCIRTECPAVDSRSCSERSHRRALCALYTQVPDVALDRGFMERDAIHDETRRRRRNEAGYQVEKLRIVYAVFVRTDDARCTGSDRFDNPSPSPRPFTIQTIKTEVFRSIARGTYHAAVKCGFADGHKHKSIRLSAGFDYRTWNFL
jgi:hypothetical protein